MLAQACETIEIIGAIGAFGVSPQAVNEADRARRRIVSTLLANTRCSDQTVTRAWAHTRRRPKRRNTTPRTRRRARDREASAAAASAAAAAVWRGRRFLLLDRSAGGSRSSRAGSDKGGRGGSHGVACSDKAGGATGERPDGRSARGAGVCVEKNGEDVQIAWFSCTYS